MVPPENGEGLQVLKYNATQKYEAHHDYFSFQVGLPKGKGTQVVSLGLGKSVCPD
jgi:hypothetical protein